MKTTMEKNLCIPPKTQEIRGMKLISWNVNGLRAVMRKNFQDFLDIHQPDILCLQEVKACKATVGTILVPFPHYVFHCAEKKGYSGTAIFSKHAPLAIRMDCEVDLKSQEGRVITAEFEGFFLVCVYVPNSKSDLSRLSYRHTEWDPSLLAYLKALENTKPVILCGDLNVAHKDIDLENPASNHFCAGFTKEERAGMQNLIDAGFIDTFRHFYPNTPKAYTWWSYRTNARARNSGWRIDYFLCSPSLQKSLKDAFILDTVGGSDHAPVGLHLAL